MTQHPERPSGATDPATPTAEQDDFIEVRAIFGTHFPELANLFLLDASRLLHRLQEAVKLENQTEIIRQAHLLSGSSVSIGAIYLSGLCSTLEAHCKATQAVDTERHLLMIQTEFARVTAQLDGLMNGMGMGKEK